MLSTRKLNNEKNNSRQLDFDIFRLFRIFGAMVIYRIYDFYLRSETLSDLSFVHWFIWVGVRFSFLYFHSFKIELHPSLYFKLTMMYLVILAPLFFIFIDDVTFQRWTFHEKNARL